MDFWKEAIKKAVNTKAKALLQSSSGICEIDLKCSWGNRPTKKEEKDSRKTKSTDTPSVYILNGKHQQSSTHQTRMVRRTKTTKEIFGTKGAKKNRVIAITPLQLVPTPTSLRKIGKTSPKSIASTVTERGTMPPNVPKKMQKTSLGLATSMLVIKIRKKMVETARAGKDGEESKGYEYLKDFLQVPCIRYFITFWKKFMLVLVLFDSNSKVNAIYPVFGQELGLLIKLIDVEAQKIDGIMLDIPGMVITAFSVINKAN